jgi:hypothetical protein
MGVWAVAVVCGGMVGTAGFGMVGMGSELREGEVEL